MGWSLLLAAFGGRHDFPNQCFPQDDGTTACTLQGYAPRSVWADVTAAGLGVATALVLVAAASAVVRRRAGRP